MNLLVSFGLMFFACETVNEERNYRVNSRRLATLETDGLITTPIHSCDEVETESAIIDLSMHTYSFDSEIIVRKNVSSSDHEVMAIAYTNGDEAIMNRYEWRIEDQSLATFTSLAWDNNRVEIHAHKDFFDNNGFEPQSLATVCAKNLCQKNLGCQTFVIVSVIDLEGDWTILGTGSTSPFETHFSQNGRIIRIEPSSGQTLVGVLFENILTLEEDHLLYSCTFTSRTHCDGTVIDTQKEKVVGDWIADKNVHD